MAEKITDTIQLKDVMEDMEQLNEFSISFVTADRKTGKGGDIINVDRAIKTGKGKANTGKGKSETPGKTVQKNPNHYHNDTINIIIQDSGEKRKVHKRLITHYNGKRVIW